ncbi:MAG: L,D-transpeptidase family protein [Bacteriovoracaceae bacterium]|nr:L,D-transpeptidase family protein [Bacteriovoracaceae bacterium]
MQSILKSTLLFIISFNVYAEEFLPANIYQLDSRFAHHVVVVEKSTHKLYLFENDNSRPKLLKTYQIATGKITGDKRVQGDEKTPEGIYRFQKFRPASDLVSSYGDYGLIYGAGAFTTNYPNIMDIRAGKTGGGIWLHSTDDDSRVGKGLDSRGCVVAVDSDLKDISKYIDLNNTPVVIVQNLHYLKESTWTANKNQLANEVLTWAKAWKEKDFDTYINQYSKTDFFNSKKGNYSQFKYYKKAIFSRTEKPEIAFRNVSILAYNDYAVVTLEQDYKSKLIQDIGKKILYFKKDANYNWKIVAEQWKKLEPSQQLSFVPSPRFFPTTEEQVVQSQERKTSNIKEN